MARIKQEMIINDESEDGLFHILNKSVSSPVIIIESEDKSSSYKQAYQKVGKYCDGVGHDVFGSDCPNPHRSGGCVKHPEVIVLDGVCAECYKNENNT